MASPNKKRMMAAACKYAYSRFTLNYYLLYEELSEDYRRSEKQTEFLKRFFGLVSRFLKGEYPAEELDVLRSQVIRETEVISAYVDRFQIFETMINGMALNFTGQPVPYVDEEQTVNQIMYYIVSAEETAERNERIRSILTMLPVRLTKAKFFSLLSHALSIYEGTGKESLEALLDSLRIEAFLKVPENMADGHQKLQELLDIMNHGNFKSPTPEEFHALEDCLEQIKDILPDETSDCLVMMELINDFYVICLTRREILMDQQEEELFREVLAKVVEELKQRESAGKDEDEEDAFGDFEELLVRMEGLQERYYDQWAKYELTDPEQDMGVEKGSDEYRILWKVERLLSTSVFMSLNPEDEIEETGILLSRRAVEEMCGQLSDELAESWKAMPKRMVRGIMARLLGCIPMFFQHTDELREFIRDSLASCTDSAEKAACAASIVEMMEEEDALV